MADDQATINAVFEQIATLTANRTKQMDDLKERFDRQQIRSEELGDRLTALEKRPTGDGLLPAPGGAIPAAATRGNGGWPATEKPPRFHRLVKV